MKRKIAFIINPASGQEEPILSYLNKVMQETHYEWEVYITKTKDDPIIFTRKALTENVDIVAVYGGDGTVTIVAQELYKRKSKVPLLILPGGTANILAKEMGFSGDTQQALKILLKKNVKIKSIDMGFIDKNPFILRLNIGILASLVTSADPQTKEKIGQMAYVVEGIKNLVDHDTITFTFEFENNRTIKEKGVALMIANAGNIGVTGFSIHPYVKVTDGYLDVILFKTAGPVSLFHWIRSMFTKKTIQGTTKHWRTKQVKVTVSPKQTVIHDDQPEELRSFTVSIVPDAVRVIVP